MDGFNEACNNTDASYLKVGDDSTSAISFWKMPKGNLHYLSCIFRNLDPLVKDF